MLGLKSLRAFSNSNIAAELPILDHAVECPLGTVRMVSANIRAPRQGLPFMHGTGHELELTVAAVNATTITNNSNVVIVTPAIAASAVVTSTIVIVILLSVVLLSIVLL